MGPALFLNIPCLVFCVVGTAGILLVACDKTGWQSAWRFVIGHPEDEATQSAAANFFAVAARAAISVGVVAMIIALHYVLRSFGLDIRTTGV